MIKQTNKTQIQINSLRLNLKEKLLKQIKTG